MELFRILQSRSKTFLPYLALLGIINSLMFSLLLIMINYAISREPFPIFPGYEWLMFYTTLVISLVLSHVFNSYLIKLTNQLLFEFEISVINKLRLANFRSFEKLGGERVHTAIGDARVLGAMPPELISALNSSIVVICGLCYLFFISVIGGIAIISVMIALLLVYLYRNKHIEKDLDKVRALQDDYYGYIMDMLNGFKELKLSAIRNNNLFHNFIKPNRLEGKRLSNSASVKYMNNELIGSYSWYIVISIIIFTFPLFLDIDIMQVTTFVVVILYLTGPVATLISTIPLYTRFKIATNRMSKFRSIVENELESTTDSETDIEPAKRFQNIRFDEVIYDYSDDSSDFKLGPINLEIGRGEVLFVTGGNGSGKSTLINLLTGLYSPSGGTLSFNGEKIDHKNVSKLRNTISAIFTNNYIFNHNYDAFDLSNSNELLWQYVNLMKLKEKIKIDEERGILNKQLSKGQLKRLALIHSLLEDRDILVIDEWAAEQDPEFRRYFYHEVIPILKKMGKTIIAVTHDDQYFDCADRILKLYFGQIIEDKSLVAEPLPTP